MDDAIYQAVRDDDDFTAEVLCIGRRADVEAAVARERAATPDPYAAWRVEPWDGPPLATPLGERFTGWRAALCASLGAATVCISWEVVLLAVSDSVWLMYGLPLAFTIPCSFAAALSGRQWRRRPTWGALAVGYTLLGGYHRLEVRGRLVARGRAGHPRLRRHDGGRRLRRPRLRPAALPASVAGAGMPPGFHPGITRPDTSHPVERVEPRRQFLQRPRGQVVAPEVGDRPEQHRVARLAQPLRGRLDVREHGVALAAGDEER